MRSELVKRRDIIVTSLAKGTIEGNLLHRHGSYPTYPGHLPKKDTKNKLKKYATTAIHLLQISLVDETCE